MNKEKFLIDTILNIISTALPLLILQLISLPIVANKLGAGSFGVIISIVSLFTVIALPLGNVLNNLRLLRNDMYEKNCIKGDFNYLLIGSSLISSVVMIVASFIYIEKINFYNITLLVLIVIFSILKEYLIVSYRISLNFKGILFNNIFLSIGYIAGTLLFYLSNYWEFIYLIGLVFSLVYITMTTKILFEPFRKTKIFKITFKEFLILYGANLIKSVLNYADKIVLLPLLGPKNVAIYYAASIIGKIISMIFNPINSVILSYLTKVNKINSKLFLKSLYLAAIVGGIGYLITIKISPLFLNLFYPIWAEDSINLIYITSASAVVTVLSSIIHPFNLRYNKLKWQVYMSGTNLVFYLIITYYLTYAYGLFGFTVAVLLSNLYNLLFQIIISYYSLKIK